MTDVYGLFTRRINPEFRMGCSARTNRNQETRARGLGSSFGPKENRNHSLIAMLPGNSISGIPEQQAVATSVNVTIGVMGHNGRQTTIVPRFSQHFGIAAAGCT